MKIKHILKSRDFKEIVETGNKYKNNLICLYRKDDSAIRELSVGVIISKKAAPKAVTRNYLKRIIYRFYSDHADTIKKGLKIVIRVIMPIAKEKRKSAAKEIRTELEELTRQAKLTDE